MPWVGEIGWNGNRSDRWIRLTNQYWESISPRTQLSSRFRTVAVYQPAFNDERTHTAKNALFSTNALLVQLLSCGSCNRYPELVLALLVTGVGLVGLQFACILVSLREYANPKVHTDLTLAWQLSLRPRKLLCGFEISLHFAARPVKQMAANSASVFKPSLLQKHSGFGY